MAIRKIKNIVPLGSLDYQNAYMDFIHTCREKVYPPETKLQLHHIIPIHDGGTNDLENLIKLSFKDHLEAHRIRYEVYKQDNDDLFIQLVSGNDQKIFTLQRQLGARATHALLKSKKENRWNSDYQRKLSILSIEKDGGGRSRGGKVGGKNRWAGHTITPDHKYLFYHQDDKISKPYAIVCTFNCNDGTEILNILNTIKPNLNFIRASPLLSGKRKSAYGWSCVKLNV